MDVGMPGVCRYVLRDRWRPVMVIVIGVSNIGALDVLQLDLEPVTDIAGVIDGIEVVDGAVGDACSLSRQGTGKEHGRKHRRLKGGQPVGEARRKSNRSYSEVCNTISNKMLISHFRNQNSRTTYYLFNVKY